MKFLTSVSIVLLAVGHLGCRSETSIDEVAVAKASDQINPSDTSQEGDLSLEDVIERAESSLRTLSSSLKDYTATFVKRDPDDDGKAKPETSIEIKTQTRTRNETNDAPRRVFLRFLSPDDVAGRKVIWGEDLYDGDMAVHETGLLLGWKTLYLPPEGMLAMQGQNYPISEIGIIKLTETLIERGKADLGKPGISVTSGTDQWNGLDVERIVISRSSPSGEESDFSRAEIVIDPEREIVLAYRSYGWPIEQGELIESYEYRNFEMNVGLSDFDFDVKNPSYGFP
ncbi:MAG: DUF1571 domain-containing protein [Planctomycetota bacterium]